MAKPLESPALPCPECRSAGRGGAARVGNHRSTCGTCNRFNQKVMRLTWRMVQDQYPKLYWDMRLRAELQLYPDLIESFVSAHPELNTAEVL